MRTEDLIHFCAPARLVMGCGTRAQLPALVERLGWRCGVLVTDRFFTQNTPWVREYVEAARVRQIDVIVFNGGEPDPSTVLCDEATASVRQKAEGRVIDHVIALGGGSNIDLAKALCLTLPGGQPIKDFVGDIGGVQPLPLVAMPTTAGTGSEATPGAILIDPENATKIAVMDNALRPQIALVDPEFTYSCPPRVTADAGIDAFTHAIESFLTLDSALYDRQGHADPGYSGRSALTMLFARESMRLCARWMVPVYQDGSLKEGRAAMAYASLYAALSYGSAGLNAVHGLAYAVAAQTHKSHGSTNAVMLPYVLDEIAAVRPHEFVELADVLGLGAMTAAEASRAVPLRVREWVGQLGIATDLKAFGIAEAALETMVKDGLAVVRLAKAFPVADVPAAYRRIVLKAFAGRLSGDA